MDESVSLHQGRCSSFRQSLHLESLSIKFVPNKSQLKRNVIVISGPIGPVLGDRFAISYLVGRHTISLISGEVLVSMTLQVTSLCEA